MLGEVEKNESENKNKKMCKQKQDAESGDKK